MQCANRPDAVLLWLQRPFAVEAYAVSETTLAEAFIEVSHLADQEEEEV